MEKENKFFSCVLILLVIMLSLFNSCKKEDDPPPLIIKTSLSDNEGNTYKAVTIGSQVWMAENLKVTKYLNGDEIGTTNPYLLNIENENSPKYQWANIDGAHSDEKLNVATYGRLYTWAVVNDSRKICPVGWHIPSHSEWIQLIDYAGGEDIAGGILKESGYLHWNSPNTAATNKYGFTALGGGLRTVSGTGNLLMMAAWWSDTEYEQNPARAWSVVMTADFKSGGFSMNPKDYGFSVRCVKD
jgi:uncharacterized protein (TIGR02145 family)